jgi:hypothetical protein
MPLEHFVTAITPQDEPPHRPSDRAPQRDRSVPSKLDEAALGGADAIPDTPSVADHGAHVGEERRRTPRGNRSTLGEVSPGKGVTMWLSLAGVVLVLVLLAVMFF